MDNTLATLIASVSLASLHPMHLLYSLLHEIIQNAAFIAAFYVAGAALCRLRKTPLKISWSALYAAVLGHALWFIFDAINGQASDKDIAILAVVAWYVFLTRASWSVAVPEVARACSTDTQQK